MWSVLWDTGRVPGHITVFKWAEKDDFSEELQRSHLAEPIQKRFPLVFSLFHGQLVETLNRFPLPQNPQASFYLIVHPIQVPQMGTAQRAIESKLLFVFNQMLEAGPCYNPAHAVANEVYDDWFLSHEGPDVVFDLICESLPHFLDVPFGVILVFPGQEVAGFGQLCLYALLDHEHIVGTALKPMAHHD